MKQRGWKAIHMGWPILLLVFAASAWHVWKTEETLAIDDGEGRKTIRIAHWLLEKGFREAIDKAIEEYEALPRVREQGIEIKQIAMSSRAYRQYINTHLISGTAPDLIGQAVASMASSGDQLAHFFEPLNYWMDRPNPYNESEPLPASLDADLARLLREEPWRETFIDGNNRGWEERLLGYYSVPVTTWGGPRIFYNKRLMQEAKERLRAAADGPRPPDWYSDLYMAEEGKPSHGLVRDSEDLRAWLASDLPPDTFGRLMMICAALSHAFGPGELGDGFSPMVNSGGTAADRHFLNVAYMVPFTSRYAPILDRDRSAVVTPLETYAGWDAGSWSLEDPPVRSYYELMGALCAQFPKGFIGLDRDQATRRFISARAAMIITGSWDATTILDGIETMMAQDDQFDVGFLPLLLPGPDERWREDMLFPANEADLDLSAPFAVNKRSKYKKEAIDFLHFLTSFAANERLARRAGWIPTIVGCEPSPHLSAFKLQQEGVKSSLRLNLWEAQGSVGTFYRGKVWLLLAGDVGYEAFVSEFGSYLSRPRVGIDRLWHDTWRAEKDAHRNQERVLSAMQMQALGSETSDAKERYAQLLQRSALNNNGDEVRAFWQRLHPGEAFPEF